MTNNRLNLRNVYLYLVCLITLIIFIVSAIQTVDNIMDIILENTEYYETYEMYKGRYIIREGNEIKLQEGKSEEGIKKEYEEYIEQVLDRQRIYNIKSLVSSIAAMIIAGGFWLYHWRKIQNERV